MNLEIITPVVNEPVVLEEAKNHLRVDANWDDSAILALIKAARIHAQSITRRGLVKASYRLTLEAWPASLYLELPLPPLHSVEAVEIGGNIIDPLKYRVVSKVVPGRIEMLNPPKGLATVEFTAGYEDCPLPIKQAILLHIGLLYENREPVTYGKEAKEIPFSYSALLSPYKLPRGGGMCGY